VAKRGVVVGTGIVAPESRILWGVPRAPEHFVAHPSLFARFHAWHRGSAVLVIAAPEGHGKSAAMASWLRAQDSSDPVIWISSGEWIKSRGDVWKTMINAMVETGVLPGEGISSVLGDPTAFAALQNLKQPVVVIFDDLDKSNVGVDLDYLARSAIQVPLVRAAAIVSRERLEVFSNSLDLVIVRAPELAWDARMVESALKNGSHLPSSSGQAAAIIEATDGRAESVVRLLGSQSATPSGKDTQDSRPSREVIFESSIAALRKRDSSGADVRALAVIALSLRAPHDCVDPTADSAELDLSLDRLLDAGVIVRLDTKNGGSSYAVPASQRVLAEAWAAEFLGADVALVHASGAAFNARDNPALTIRHLALLSRFDDAIAVLKARWWEAGDTREISELRAALAVIPDSSYRLDITALAICLLVERLPAADRSKRVDLEAWLVKDAARFLGALPAGGGFLETAAIIWAVLSQGRAREAIELASEVARRARDQQWAAEISRSHELAVLVVTAAEVLLTVGLAGQAAPLIRLAENLFAGSTSAFAHFRTASLDAMAHAFDGDWASAAALVQRANAIYDGEAWPSAEVEYTTTVATALIAHAQLDAVGMASAASWFDKFVREHSNWRAAARLCRAYALLFEAKPAAALAMLRQFTHRMQLMDSPVPAALAAALGADLWTATGRPGQAIDALVGVESSPDHSMCFAVQRASARLALGQPRLALSETDGCIRLGSQHSLQTLPAVLARRAIAHELLGHTEAADDQFLEFLMLMQAGFVRAPLLNLISSSLDALIVRATRKHPALEEFLAYFAAVVIEVAPLLRADPSASLLSERERRVLELLATGVTVSSIASSLFVSPNTVKSQISSIYRKLGISSRAQAADAAASMGLALDRTD
jgi:DNA-binding CsgD family transcriptional regulator